MPKKESFLQKFYNAAKEFAGFSTMPTVDDVRAVYGPAQTLGAPEEVRVAMDSQLYDSGVYSLIQHTVELGQMPMAEFVGYGMLQSMSQNGLLRACIETVADDMTRNWIKLEKGLDDPDADADGEISPEEKERIKEEEREGSTLVDEMMRTMNKYHLREVFHDAQELVGYEGGAMIYIDTGAIGEELKTPLNLTNYTGELKMGDLKGFIVVDPVNVFPGLYNSTDPLRTDYFVPKTWWVLGQEVHESRLVRLVDNEVPILLRPSYNFMGIPQAQILWDYVLHFQQCRIAATELVTKHSMTVFKTQIGDILFSGEGTRALDTRIKYFKQNRDNLNIVAIDKENEDLVNVESSVAGVDSICKQSLEYLAAINRTPAVKLLGLSPTGFNATGESDIRNYYDHIKSQQEKIFRDGLQKCLDVLQLNLNGKIDKSLKFEFVQLSEEDKNTLVQYQKTKADVIGGLLDHNIISGEEARKALSDDPDSGFSGLDPDEVPEDEGGAGEMPGMGGEMPEGMGGEPPQGSNPEEGPAAPEGEEKQQPPEGQVDKPTAGDKIMAGSRGLAQDAGEEDERWITTKNNHRVLIDEEGTVRAGMGGKFDGEKINTVAKTSKPSSPSEDKTKKLDSLLDDLEKIQIQQDLNTFNFMNKQISVTEFKAKNAELKKQKEPIQIEVANLQKSGVMSTAEKQAEERKEQEKSALRQNVKQMSDEWEKQFPNDVANPVTPVDPKVLTKDEIIQSLPPAWGAEHAQEFVDAVHNYTKQHTDKDEYRKSKYNAAVDYGIRHSSLKWDNGVIYRGTGVKQAEFDTYKVGGVLTQHGLSSWSQDKLKAESFKNDDEGKVPVVFIDKTQGPRNAMSVEDISAFRGAQTEKEVLYAIDQPFRILSMKQEGGRNLIEVEAVRKKA